MMFFLLVKVRIRSVINTARDRLRASPWFSGGMAVAGVVLFALTFVGFLVFFRIAAQMTVLSETAFQVFYFLFLFLLAGSVPFVASTLLHSADYRLLFAAPVPPHAVIAAKLLDATVINSLQFAVLGMPALVACAFVLDVNATGWVLLPLLIGLFVLVPALLTALGLLFLLLLLGVERVRSAVTALNAVMAAVACITIVLESPHLPVKPGADMVTGQQAQVTLASQAAHTLPSAWFAETIIGYSQRSGANTMDAVHALGKIILLIALLGGACLLLGGRLLSAANLAEEAGSGFTGSDSGQHTVWEKLFRGPIGALLAKDWRYLRRDSVLLSQLSMPMILYIVPFLLTLQDSSRRTYGETFYFAGAIIGVILFMQTSILSLSSMGLESRGFWVIMTSPNRSRTLLQAKFLLSTLFTAVVGIGLTLIAGIVFNAAPILVLIQSLFVLISTASLSGLGVGLAAAFPRFVYENPAHRVSTWALILGFFATTGYLTISGILFAVAWLVAINFPLGNMPVMAYSLAVALYLILSACAIYIPLAVGARRVERYQWEH